ncbi:hypothetical protein O6H91_15G026400 [Diphasiastrum complanatum]|uniref:Uncharacterized protein n=1 Tax=Diphasiastrum complanatum TaxID=34168 RepID=A0ACC2BGQ0_DIPCM|nr:hypothetical protein O6H91_15G026400 [Diphasiastrum complanatum]
MEAHAMELTKIFKVLITGILYIVCRKLFLASTSTIESDVVALQSIMKAWPREPTWSGSDPCGLKWQGVTCDEATNTRVTKLNIIAGGLEGSLFPIIGSLINLVSLDLSFNQLLTGPLPKELGNLENLQILNLQSCSFTGSIPAELGNLTQLNFLALNGNHFSGHIPSSLGKLSNVIWFDLSENLLSGNLPVSTDNQEQVGLDTLTAAKHLHLSKNSFSGFLPKELCYMPNVIHLLLDGNNLSGPIPSDVSNLLSMEILRLDNNHLEGEIPLGINNLVSLNELHLSNNSLRGTIPDFSNLQQLRLLRLSINLFDLQVIPNSIINLTMLETIEMDDNNLTGTIPPQLFELPSLEAVSLRSNQIGGILQLNDLAKSLAYISLDNNDISDISGLLFTSEYSLALEGNPVCDDPTKNLPSIICSTGVVIKSWEADHSISCNVSCKDNELLSPECICTFPLILLFQFNAPSFSDINTNKVNDLQNQLMTHLHLSTGQVWIGKANFTDDHRLLVNVLIFPFASEPWTQENVSNIINRISTNFTLDNFGPYQLNYVLLPPSIGDLKRTVYTKSIIVGVIVGVLGVIVLLTLVGIYTIWRKRRCIRAEASNKLYGRSIKQNAPQLKGGHWFSLGELKRATNNFSPRNQIGNGGYGKVYTGCLLSGQVIAIKRAKPGSFQGATEFKTELELLSRLHHKNLVALIGFCHEQGEQMLVYEHMPNGTLGDHLHGKGGRLSWKTRIEIAVDAAKGIAYLHELASPAVIHRDIKTSNILLDENFTAKVSDFGLSKLLIVDEGAHPDGHISTQVKGTLGYLDPAYYLTRKITQKSDVYSFGVVLLELITARLPIENGKYIVREMREAWDRKNVDAIKAFLDPTLQNYDQKDLEYFMSLAFTLLKECAPARPSMGEVVKSLELLLASVDQNTAEPNASIGSSDLTTPYLSPENQNSPPSREDDH